MSTEVLPLPYTVDLAGTANDARQQVLAEVLARVETSTEPPSIVLVREPDNLYDPNSVKVIVDHQHVGYLPRFLAARVAPRMDEGEEFAAMGLRIAPRLVITHAVGGERYVATVTVDSARKAVV